jgi:Ca-activated chloride channel homolog
MRHLFQSLLGLIFLVTCAQGQSPSPTPAPQPNRIQNGEEVDSGDVLRISSNLVSVPVIVTNRRGQYVTDLQRSDFRIFEDGKEQPIVHFSNVDQPLSVVLLIDTSGSTSPFIDQIKTAAKAFVDQLRPTDTVRPVYFHGEIKALTASGVNDPKVFAAAIERIQPGPPNLGTRLYDAVDFGLKSLQAVAPRKAIILLTDGENTWGKATMKSTLRDAEESGVVAYTVQYADFVPQKYLQQLAEKTGGRYFRGGDSDTLRQSFSEISAELRRQYVLGYRLNPEVTGGMRKIKVKVARKNVSVRARASYTYGP